MDDASLAQLAQLLEGDSFPPPKVGQQPPLGSEILAQEVPVQLRAVITLAERLRPIVTQETFTFLGQLIITKLHDMTLGGTVYAVPPQLGITPDWKIFLVWPTDS